MQRRFLKLFLPILLISACPFTSTFGHGEKGKKFTSVFKEGIVVNGNSQEWENSLFNFDKSAKVNYAIVNDTAALYICLRIADEETQRKIIRSGIEIQFNSKGKKKPEAVLHFPTGGRILQSEHNDKKTMHLMFLLQMQNMELRGFKDGFNGSRNIKSGNHGIQAALTWDSVNVMVYEARVPFDVFEEDVRTASPLAVGIIIKGAPKPKEGEKSDIQDEGGGQMRGGGQGRPEGMQQGGMGREGQVQRYQPDNSGIFEDDEIWRMIEIAKKE